MTGANLTTIINKLGKENIVSFAWQPSGNIVVNKKNNACFAIKGEEIYFVSNAENHISDYGYKHGIRVDVVDISSLSTVTAVFPVEKKADLKTLVQNLGISDAELELAIDSVIIRNKYFDKPLPQVEEKQYNIPNLMKFASECIAELDGNKIKLTTPNAGYIDRDEVMKETTIYVFGIFGGVEIAKANQDSTDWENTTDLMKNIQKEWKEIGSVPLKNTEKIWKEFKKACDTYFSRYAEAVQATKNKATDALQRKKEFLDKLKEYQLGTDREKEIETLQQFVNQWNEIGNSSYSKKSIDLKFHKIIDALYKKLNFDKQEIEIIKYNNKLERLINDDNENSLNNEVLFVKRRIDEIKSEVLQLENNLAFFGKIDEKNPLVRDVVKNIHNQKENLKTWENKLRELKNLQKTQQAEDTASQEEKE